MIQNYILFQSTAFPKLKYLIHMSWQKTTSQDINSLIERSNVNNTIVGKEKNRFVYLTSTNLSSGKNF